MAPALRPEGRLSHPVRSIAATTLMLVDLSVSSRRSRCWCCYGSMAQALSSASLLISSIILRLITNEIASRGNRPNRMRLFQFGLWS